MNRRIIRITYWILGGFFASLLLSVVYYLVFALLFSSDLDKHFKEENRLYEKYLPGVEMDARLLDDELEFLRARDENVYREVFKADSPMVSELLEGDILLEDVQGKSDFVTRAGIQGARAMEEAARVDDCWREIYDSLNAKGYSLPPMTMPVNGLNYTNVGASVGDKISPFYKVAVYHDGLDLIAPAQTAVVASGAGTVSDVQKARGGRGNMVEIRHPGGYVTRYAHLGSISVKKGQKVSAGTKIGEVGDSGRSFTTHLHYEVERNGIKLDPNNFFFGTLTPNEYLRFMIMSASSGQSMD